MEPITTGILAAGSMALGAGSAHQATKRRRNARRRGQGVLDYNRSTINSGFQQSQQSLFEAMGLTTRGFEEASAEIGRLGGQAKRGIQDQGQQALAQAGSQLQRSGFGGGSMMANLRAGVGAQVGRGMASVDESIAGMMSEVLQRKGMAQAQIQANLANLYRDRTFSLVQNEMARFNLLAEINTPQFQGTSSDLSGLAGLFSDQRGDHQRAFEKFGVTS